ncbi:MAG: YebC/PmpR family DNA-binding transcriptional regulator [Fidelibacterota bacterium]
MSGHSKWSTIKRKKAREDVRRGKIFTKLIKEITIAAREGGGDENSNPRLRVAIAAAKAENMPAANIERALKRGTGELPGSTYEEYTYEGYGPGGAALLIDVLTDNRNRTVAEIRHIMSKRGGNLGEPGCVSWMFDKKGFIVIPADSVEEDEVLSVSLDFGADDVKLEGESYEVITPQVDFEKIKKAFYEREIPVETAKITMIPKNTVRVEGEDARRLLQLMDAIEDLDDVQNIFSNFDIRDEILETYNSGR